MKTKEVKLYLPVMDRPEAMKAGFASIAQPVSVNGQPEVLKSMDASMRGTQAVWVKCPMGPHCMSLELFRKRSELKGDAAVG